MTSVGGGMRSAIPPESIPEALHDAPNGPTLPEPLCGGSESDEMARGTTTLAAVSSIAATISVTLRPPPSLHDVAVQLGLVGLRLRPVDRFGRGAHGAQVQGGLEQRPGRKGLAISILSTAGPHTAQDAQPDFGSKAELASAERERRGHPARAVGYEVDDRRGELD